MNVILGAVTFFHPVILLCLESKGTYPPTYIHSIGGFKL